MKLALKQTARPDDFSDFVFDDETMKTIGDIRVLESHIIYFSAGGAPIKEMLVKRDPSYSV